MTPTGNDDLTAQAETLRELILWCREHEIHARALEVGDVSLDFYDAKLLKGGIALAASTPSPGGDPEEGRRDTGSADELWAEQLGVNLDEGTKEGGA